MGFSLSQYTLFVLLAPLAAFVTVGVLLYAWRYRAGGEIAALLWLMVSVTGWLLGNTLELLASTPATTVFWTKVSYPFIVATPVSWLIFALQYAGKGRWLTRTRLLILGTIPLLTVLLVWSNEFHFLVWTSYEFKPLGRLLAFHVGHGPWFWVHAFYNYTLMLVGAYLIAQRYFSSFRLYRRQSFWMIVGALTPVLFNIIYVFDLVPGLRKDFTPVSFALAAFSLAVGIFRYQLFELQPVARDLIIERMPEPVFTLDTQGRVIDVNPAAQTLVESQDADPVGRPAAEVLRPWPQLVECLQSDAGEYSVTIEHHGASYVYDLQLVPISNRRGHAVGRLLSLRDVTARQRSEEALRQRTQELEARNRELDAFAHMTAHDLKTPLTALVGFATLLRVNRHQMPDASVQSSLEEIITSGQKMVDIVDGLLLLASVRRRSDIIVQPVDMHSLVSAALHRLDALMSERQAVISLPEEWPVVLGYPPWVEEVWANYLGNALKYGGRPEKGIAPRIEMGWEAQARASASPAYEPPGDEAAPSQIRFWIRDNGPGIAPQQIEQLFEEFARLDTGEQQGYGLGLSIVQRIVTRLGGEVGVESVLGEGSTFWFTLPPAPEESV